MGRIMLMVLSAIFSLKQQFISQALLQERFVSNGYAFLRRFIVLLIVASGIAPSLLVICKIHLLNRDIYYIALMFYIFSIVSLTIFVIVLERIMCMFHNAAVPSHDDIKASDQKRRETVRESERANDV